MRISCEKLPKRSGNKITQMKFRVDKCKVHVHWGKKSLFHTEDDGL